MGIPGVAATASKQIGYSVADLVANAVFGVLIWAIAVDKTRFTIQSLPQADGSVEPQRVHTTVVSPSVPSRRRPRAARRKTLEEITPGAASPF